jgi:hypothetical protein
MRAYPGSILATRAASAKRLPLFTTNFAPDDELDRHPAIAFLVRSRCELFTVQDTGRTAIIVAHLRKIKARFRPRKRRTPEPLTARRVKIIIRAVA